MVSGSKVGRPRGALRRFRSFGFRSVERDVIKSEAKRRRDSGWRAWKARKAAVTISCAFQTCFGIIDFKLNCGVKGLRFRCKGVWVSESLGCRAWNLG